ncbi:MAG: S26 family signal peptidase [Smithella sp.]
MKKLLVKSIKTFLLYLGFCFVLCLMPLINPLLTDVSLSFVSGESMLPTIKEGDLVISRPYKAERDELKKGMIVRFWEEEDNKTISVQHRIVEVLTEGVVTLGDNNELGDGLIKYSQIHSIYCFKIPFHYLGVGEISSFLFLFTDKMKENVLGLPACFYLILFLVLEGSSLVARRKTQRIRKG